MHDGKLKPEDLDKTLVNDIFDELNQGASKGMTQALWKPENSATVRALQRNLWRFSGAKTYQQLETMRDALINKDGKIRSFAKFKKEVAKTFKQYNVHYLQAEYQTALKSGQSVRQWKKFEEGKDVFPNLEYVTVKDNRVRDEHDKLHGIIKPVDDPFWNTHTPPNGWRCRCYLKQTRKEATADKDTPEVIIKPAFENNPSKTGEVFNKHHPYFVLPEVQDTAAFELSKQYAPYYRAFKGKAEVWVSLFADPSDLEENLKSAIVLAKQGIDVRIRAHVKDLYKHKNPEYEIAGKIGDKKLPLSQNYKNIFRKAVKQEVETLVLDLSKNKDTIENAKFKVNGMLRNQFLYVTIQKVIIVLGDKVEIVERKKAT